LRLQSDLRGTPCTSSFSIYTYICIYIRSLPRKRLRRRVGLYDNDIIIIVIIIVSRTREYNMFILRTASGLPGPRKPRSKHDVLRSRPPADRVIKKLLENVMTRYRVTRFSKTDFVSATLETLTSNRHTKQDETGTFF